MEKRESLNSILSYMPPRIRSHLERSRNIYAPNVQEIALRSDRPLCIYCTGKRYYLDSAGSLVDQADCADLIAVTAAEMQEVFMNLCDYSVYSRQDELIRGYVTVASGARVGICGAAVLKDGQVAGVRRITTLSFRVPREVKGCGELPLRLIEPLRGVLVCGPPCSGKTTLVRDMARLLSFQYKVSVIDERGELAGSSDSAFGYDMGFADVYVHMPKSDGVMCAIRSMSPDIIICDELGDADDIADVRYALRCGVSFIATVHASAIDDLRGRAVTRDLLSTGAFRYLVFLGERRFSGKISRIYEWRTGHA